AAAPTADVAQTLQGHSELVYSVAFSPDGKFIATGSFDKTAKLWGAATGKEVKTYGGPAGHQKLVLNLAFSPDGRTLATCGEDNTVKLWDVPAVGPLREFLGHTDQVNAVALTPDGTKLATAGNDQAVRIWTTADGKQLAAC